MGRGQVRPGTENRPQGWDPGDPKLSFTPPEQRASWTRCPVGLPDFDPTPPRRTRRQLRDPTWQPPGRASRGSLLGLHQGSQESSAGCPTFHRPTQLPGEESEATRPPWQGRAGLFKRCRMLTAHAKLHAAPQHLCAGGRVPGARGWWRWAMSPFSCSRNDGHAKGPLLCASPLLSYDLAPFFLPSFKAGLEQTGRSSAPTAPHDAEGTDCSSVPAPPATQARRVAALGAGGDSSPLPLAARALKSRTLQAQCPPCLNC